MKKATKQRLIFLDSHSSGGDLDPMATVIGASHSETLYRH